MKNGPCHFTFSIDWITLVTLVKQDLLPQSLLSKFNSYQQQYVAVNITRIYIFLICF